MANWLLKSLSYSIIFSITLYIKAGSLDYIYPSRGPSFSNYGTLGIIQNPNGRFLEEGSIGFSWSSLDPYLRGSIVAYPFDWLEASFQYSDINNALYSRVEAFSGSQSLKDKSFDIKLRLLRETNFLPQIAVGIRDLGGTGIFSAEYLTFNKFLSSGTDITFGFGWGNLNGNQISSNPFELISPSFKKRTNSKAGGGRLNLESLFSGDAGVFFGIEHFIPRFKGLRIKAEYDGTNWETEGAKPVLASSNINIGLVYPVTKNFLTKFSFAKGNTINFGFSYALNLGKRNPRNIKKQPPISIENNELVKIVTQRSETNLYRASLKYLSDDNISLQKASLEDNKYEVVYSQSKYRSLSQSMGRVLNILDQISPEEVTTFKVSEINGGLGMGSLEVDRDSLSRYGKFNAPTVVNEAMVTSPYKFEENKYKFNPAIRYPAFFGSISPDLRSQIGGPDGFFFGDLRLTLNTETLLSRNLSILAVGTFGLYDNFDELKLPSDSILPHVRTDIVKYLKGASGFSIRRLQMNYYLQPSDSIFMKFSGGILESMFGGYGFEALYRPFDKNFGIGIDAWKAKQRTFDQMLSFQNYEIITGHATFYYHEPRTHILFKIKGGRYLAGDSGFTFDFSRRFTSGLRMGAFFSLTDISYEEFGEGSFDKGFYFWIPLDIFSPRHMKQTFGWGLRPITRDGAQSIIHGHPMWGVTDPSSQHFFNRDIGIFYD